MNFNETIISSFFFHLILLLLLVAVSDYMTRVSGEMGIISVDLSREDNHAQPAATKTDEGARPDSSHPSEGQMRLPEQASNPPEVSKPVPEPEKKAAPPVEPAKIGGTEKPPMSLEDYHHFIALHNKMFRQQTSARVNELLGEAFKTNTREFFGGTAVVSLKFGPDSKVTEVLVDSASQELKAFFEEIGWGDMPAPASFSLGYAQVKIEFSVLEGYMNFNITPL